MTHLPAPLLALVRTVAIAGGAVTYACALAAYAAYRGACLACDWCAS